MKYLLFFVFMTSIRFGYCQTYSKVISDSEIVNFINADILKDSIKLTKAVRRKIFQLNLTEFYYKDSSDFIDKNKNSQFIFRYHIIRGEEYTNHLDTLFSRRDIDFFYKQIKGLKKKAFWSKSFANSIIVDNVELDSNRYAKQIMYTYSIPLFTLDKQRVIIIKGFYCGFLCGGGGYCVYEKDKESNWLLIRKFNEWGE